MSIVVPLAGDRDIKRDMLNHLLVCNHQIGLLWIVHCPPIQTVINIIIDDHEVDARTRRQLPQIITGVIDRGQLTVAAATPHALAVGGFVGSIAGAVRGAGRHNKAKGQALDDKGIKVAAQHIGAGALAQPLNRR